MSFVKSFVSIVVVLCFFNHKVHNGQHRALKVVLIFIKNLVAVIAERMRPCIKRMRESFLLGGGGIYRTEMRFTTTSVPEVTRTK